MIVPIFFLYSEKTPQNVGLYAADNYLKTRANACKVVRTIQAKPVSNLQL